MSILKKGFQVLTASILLISCTTTESIKENERGSKYQLTNLIYELNFSQDISIIDPVNEMKISVKPVDTRKFDNYLADVNYSDGRHKTIFANFEEVKGEADSTKDSGDIKLFNMLMENGLRFEDAIEVLDIIQNEKEPKDEIIISSSNDIYLNSVTGFSLLNPFVFDNRYLALFEVFMQNNSESYKKICPDYFFIESASILYEPYPSEELLKRIGAESKHYEVLNSLLFTNCQYVPPKTSVRTYLLFPSFYSNQAFTLHYKNDGSFVKSNEIKVDLSRSEKVYSFNSFEIEERKEQRSRLVSSSANDGKTVYIDKPYFFLKHGNSLFHVGNKEFLIQEEIDLNDLKIISIKYISENEIKVVTTHITKSDIERGEINISYSR